MEECKTHSNNSLHLSRCISVEDHAVHLKSLLSDGALTKEPFMNFIVMANHAIMMPSPGVYFTSSSMAKDYIRYNYPDSDFRLLIVQVVGTNGR